MEQKENLLELENNEEILKQEEQEIKILLHKFLNDDSKIIELEQYGMEQVMNIAFKNDMYEEMLKLFKPQTITTENETYVKIFIDPFSTNILNQIMESFETDEQAILTSKAEYEFNQKMNQLYKENELWDQDTRSLTEIYSTKKVMNEEIKEWLLNSIYNLDFELLNQIKIKNSHERKIKGTTKDFKTIEDIIYYIEPACLKACINLFNKNIKVITSDTEGVIDDGIIENGACRLTIDFNSLDEQNKLVGEMLIKEGKALKHMEGTTIAISIFVPCNREETIETISTNLEHIAQNFQIQDILYGKTELEEQMKEITYLSNIYPEAWNTCFKDGITTERIVKFKNMFGENLKYDKEEGIMWKSEIYYTKHKAYLETQNIKKYTK